MLADKNIAIKDGINTGVFETVSKNFHIYMFVSHLVDNELQHGPPAN